MGDALRLDVALQQKYPQYTRSLLQKMIKNGHVLVDDEIVKTVKTPVNSAVRIELDTAPLAMTSQEDLSLEVIYEDDDCMVINKPVGVLVHSKGAYNPEPTVASWLKARDGFSFADVNERSGIVHRLDRATSGVMICAKNKVMLGQLQKQFQLRKAKKTYIALVDGVVEPSHAMIDLPIERNPKKPQTFRAGSNGKSAQTEYKVKELVGSSCLLELKPITGRTHQLRVHLNHIKHPIVGDDLYSGRPANRMYLHAASLEVTISGGKRMTFEAPLPADFTSEAAA